MVNAAGKVIGVITMNELMYRLSKGHMKPVSTIVDRINRKFRPVGGDMPLNELVRVLVRAPYAMVAAKSGKERLVTSADMVDFMTAGEVAVAVKEEEAQPAVVAQPAV